MDWIKFVFLGIACTSGFITTSYSSLAKEKGWPVGHLFIVERGSYIIIIGFICQLGSLIASLFVNPWWSAILVLVFGYIGYILLTSIFKKYSQMIGGVMVILSFIIVPIFVFGKKSVDKENATHCIQSINYANNPLRICDKRF